MSLPTWSVATENGHGAGSTGHGRLAGKVVVITGAANGIGRTMACLFADAGADVVVADVDETAGPETVAEITSAGHAAGYQYVDISRADDVEAMIRGVLREKGRIDVLVNNAGIGLNRPFLDTTLEDWNRTLGVVLTGTFLCSQAAARAMVLQGQGTIVNVASISGQRGAQGRTAYGVAKAGVIQLTRVMAVELASRGIRVNAVSPGPVDTYQSRTTHTPATRRSYFERIPLHRYGESEEVALAALFLASDESRFVHGHVLNVDGGFHAAGLMFDADDPSTGNGSMDEDAAHTAGGNGVAPRSVLPANT